MAAAERIRELRANAGRVDPEDEEALGLILVEDVLWGYDVNLTATHMAASTLGMLAPSTSFGRMNVHRALLGVFNDVAYLGSLEFLDGQARLKSWPSAAHQVEDEQIESERPPPMDLVIMNPPFTRDSLRHDQFSRKDEEAIKNREKVVLGDDLDIPLVSQGSRRPRTCSRATALVRRRIYCVGKQVDQVRHRHARADIAISRANSSWQCRIAQVPCQVFSRRYYRIVPRSRANLLLRKHQHW